MRANEFTNQLPNENSLGKPITNDPEALKNFWNWFKGSKVVDSQGRPLVVYHGTGSDFKEFKNGKIKDRFFTTPAPSGANYYATNDGENSRNIEASNMNVMPLYLSIKNPSYVDEWHHALVDNFHEHDGVFVGTWSDVMGYAVAFSPNQIKSAIGNKGTFNPNSPNITEARRNPEQNPKEDGHLSAYKKIKQMIKGGIDPSTIGVSMTNLPKLGINPQSNYDTPIGIYFYPAAYYLEEIGNSLTGNAGGLPFQQNAPYIQIFTFDNSDTIDTNKFKKPQLVKSIERMSHIAKKLDNELQAEFNIAIDVMREDAKVNSNAGMFWYLTLTLSNYMMNGSKLLNGNSIPVAWNKLIRKLGYTSIVDTNGVVHENEPTQGVIFDPRIIQSNFTINNTRALGKRSVNILKSGDPEQIKDHIAKEIGSAAMATHRIPQLEKQAIKYSVPLNYLVRYASENKFRWKELEQLLTKPENYKYSVEYAKDVLKDNNPGTWQKRYNAGQIK